MYVRVLLRRLAMRAVRVAGLGLALAGLLLLSPVVSASSASPPSSTSALRLDITRGLDLSVRPHIGPFELMDAGAGRQGPDALVGADFSTSLSTLLDGQNVLCLDVTGGRAYVGTADGLSIYDISDPTNPTYVGGTNGWIYAVDVSDGYAYVKVNNDTDNNYVAVLDVHEATPQLVTFINPPAIPHDPSGFPPQLLFNDSLLVDGGHLYIGEEDFYNWDFSWRALDIYDVADPAHPALVAQPPIGGNVDRLAIQGGYLYLAERTKLETVRIGTPAEASVTSTIETGASGLAVTEDYLFCGESISVGEVNVFSLANPAAPATLGTIECKTSYLYLVEDLAIAHPSPGRDWLLTAWSASPLEFRVVEVMDVTPPIRLGEQSLVSWKGDVANVTDNSVNAMAVDGVVAFVAQDEGGVRLSSIGGANPGADDQTPPITAVTGADAKWHRSAVTLWLSAEDEAGGSGLADIFFALDDGDFQALGYPTYTGVTIKPEADHSFDGPHQFWYAAADYAQNIETPRSVTVKFDTLGPATKALQSVSVRRGSRATVKYTVSDAWSPKATVTIKIRTLGGRTVKSVAAGLKPTGRSLSTSFTCKLSRGSYRFSVYAKDLAGNKQTVLGRAGFRVR